MRFCGDDEGPDQLYAKAHRHTGWHINCPLIRERKCARLFRRQAYIGEAEAWLPALFGRLVVASILWAWRIPTMSVSARSARS